MDKQVVAFCGTRGLPANYGGFETAVDEISLRFVKSGYESEVFCRHSNNTTLLKDFQDRKLVYVKGSPIKKLDTFISSFQTGLVLWKNRKKYKHIFWFNNANLPGIIISLLTNIPVSINTDGLEWRRAKWSLPFKVYYFLSSFIISLLCKNLISDSVSIQEYYKRVFFKKTMFIPYGIPQIPAVTDKIVKETLDEYKLKAGEYFLQITRFEPDNNPLLVVQGFRQFHEKHENFKFVLVGYKDETEYSKKIKDLSGKDGIVVLDAIYDKNILFILRKYCYGYVHGNSVGGTNPALLEAMMSSPRVIAINCPFSREVLGKEGIFFHTNDVTSALNKSLTLDKNTNNLFARVTTKYNWDEVAQCYMHLVEGEHVNYKL